MPQPTYLHLTETNLIGYVGNTITTQITLTQLPTLPQATSVFAIQNAAGLGYEFAPDPGSNGAMSYRYTATSTNTVLQFDAGTGDAEIDAQRLVVKAQGNGNPVIVMRPNQTTGKPYMAFTTGDTANGTGILVNISAQNEPSIQFYKSSNTTYNFFPNAGPGTLVAASTIRTQNLIVSSISSIDTYTTNLIANTGVISSFAARQAIISSLTYTTIVGPSILQIQNITF